MSQFQGPPSHQSHTIGPPVPDFNRGGNASPCIADTFGHGGGNHNEPALKEHVATMLPRFHRDTCNHGPPRVSRKCLLFTREIAYIMLQPVAAVGCAPRQDFVSLCYLIAFPCVPELLIAPYHELRALFLGVNVHTRGLGLTIVSSFFAASLLL